MRYHCRNVQSICYTKFGSVGLLWRPTPSIRQILRRTTRWCFDHFAVNFLDVSALLEQLIDMNWNHTYCSNTHAHSHRPIQHLFSLIGSLTMDCNSRCPNAISFERTICVRRLYISSNRSANVSWPMCEVLPVTLLTLWAKRRIFCFNNVFYTCFLILLTFYFFQWHCYF